MKKFGIYRNLNITKDSPSKPTNHSQTVKDNGSKIYAYKLLLKQHEEVLNKLNVKK